MRKILTMLLISGLLLGGTVLGSGDTEAKARIVPGRYTAQMWEFGAIPTPLANARIIGSTYYQYYYGVGPRNTLVLQLYKTKHGMIASAGRDPLARWNYRIEYRQMPYGYKGVIYNMGLPMGDMVLRRVR